MDIRARKRPPARPGRTLRNHYLEPPSMTVTDMARVLDVSRKTVSKIVNERGSVTSDMALRLSQALDTTPDLWLNLQKNYDLWHAAHDSKDIWGYITKILRKKGIRFSAQRGAKV